MQSKQFNSLFEKILLEAERLCRYHHLPVKTRTRFFSRLADLYMNFHPEGGGSTDYPVLSSWKIRKIFSREYPLDEAFPGESYGGSD